MVWPQQRAVQIGEYGPAVMSAMVHVR